MSGLTGIRGPGAPVRVDAELLHVIATDGGLLAVVDICGNRVAVPYAELAFKPKGQVA